MSSGDLAESYDVVCVGGSLMGSSVAFFLSENPDFDGDVLVVEPDWSYENTSTMRSQASIREQFSNPVNIRASQFAMDFIADFHNNVQVEGAAPEINFIGTGYLFLAKSDTQLASLRSVHEVQLAEHADVQMLSQAQVQEKFAYMNTENIVGARFGGKREGSLDAWALLQGFRQRARHNGVRYIRDRVIGLERAGNRVMSVRLESGRSVGCGYVVNAAGPRAKLVAEMVGLRLPVEPRSRSSFVFACRESIDQLVPLTITPEGVHFRRDQQNYVTGTPPLDDRVVDYNDLAVRTEQFEDQIWPVLAAYVPQFDRISVVASWGGQYAYNVLDQNMIVGTGSEIENFIFANGFSGHGLQQSPAVGRGVSELVTYGEYRTLDLSELGFERVRRNEPFLETAII
ncbi:MAG: NAD(P)/FAD-dependent oxidoreductase [Acidimicrobiales bacterium]